MPCMKCANGKWKYGVHGNCQFDTLAACKAAAAAIHINDPAKGDKPMAKKPKEPMGISTPAGPHQAPNHPYTANALPMVPVAPELVDPCPDFCPPSNSEDMTDAMKQQ